MSTVPWPQLVAPIDQPLIDEDDIEQCSWFDGQHAGGHIMTWGQHRGKRMNTLGEDYLGWCSKNLKRALKFAAAFRCLKEGLLKHAEDNYLDFRVPFGKVYRGKRLRDCRDKPYFKYCSRNEILREKFPCFFRALERHFENPRTESVWRDVGELLSATEYADDLELSLQDRPAESNTELGDDYEATQSDKDFIVSDSAPLEVEESDDESEEEFEAYKKSRTRTSQESVPIYSTPKKSRKSDRPKATTPKHKKKKSQRKRSSKDNFIDDGDEDSDSSASYRASDSESQRPKATPPKHKKKKSQRKRSSKDNFIDDGDEDSDSSASYRASDSESQRPKATPPKHKKKKSQRKRSSKDDFIDDGDEDSDGSASYRASDSDCSSTGKSPRTRAKRAAKPKASKKSKPRDRFSCCSDYDEVFDNTPVNALKELRCKRCVPSDAASASPEPSGSNSKRANSGSRPSNSTRPVKKLKTLKVEMQEAFHEEVEQKTRSKISRSMKGKRRV